MENEKKISVPDRIVGLTEKIGYELIKSGSEICRAEESLIIAADSFGATDVRIFAIPSTVIISFLYDGKYYTGQYRIKDSETDLDRLAKLNGLCRDIGNGKLGLEQAEKEFEKIKRSKTYPQYVLFIAYAAAAFFFTLFWGGSFIDAAVAIFCGIVVKLTVWLAKRLQLGNLSAYMTSSFAVSLFAGIFMHYFPVINQDSVIIGALMLLTPGIAITNVMRDLLAGDTLTGIIRFTEIAVVGLGLAIGIACSTLLLSYVF